MLTYINKNFKPLKPAQIIGKTERLFKPDKFLGIRQEGENIIPPKIL